MTTEELKQILQKNGSSNYWVQRAVAALAEENGIPVTDLPLDSSLDVKLSVLDELRNCREIICIFLESMLIYVMNEFSDSGGHFHGT